jgi:Raf kinase inhibitor-like YbhB/YbcL family protein
MLEKLPEGVGESLQNQRAGIENTVFYRLDNGELPRLAVLSDAFVTGGQIPILYTADGIGHSPPLKWRNAPGSAASIVVITEDADSPTPHPLVHAIVVNLPTEDGGLEEGALNSPEHVGEGLTTGRNSFFGQAWLPPDPPPGHGLHRYVFQVFALSSGVPFSRVPGRTELFDAIKARAVAGGYIVGTYERAQRVRTTQVEQETIEEPTLAAVPA